MTNYQMAIAKLALALGYYQHTIAGFFGCNQGRVSEFKNGPLFGFVAAAHALPPGFPPLR